MNGLRDYPGPWCTRCGQPAHRVASSLDPDHPIGRCLRGTPKSEGCGEVITTRLVAEAEAIFDARRRRLVTSRHAQHVDSQGRPKARPYCDKCPPVTATTPRV